VLGLIGRNAAGDKVQLWRRGAVIAGGLFFLYYGSRYYWPKYRKIREQLDREWERDSEHEIIIEPNDLDG